MLLDWGENPGEKTGGEGKGGFGEGQNVTRKPGNVGDIKR